MGRHRGSRNAVRDRPKKRPIAAPVAMRFEDQIRPGAAGPIGAVTGRTARTKDLSAKSDVGVCGVGIVNREIWTPGRKDRLQVIRASRIEHREQLSPTYIIE